MPLLVQAESMTLTAPMSALYDIAAMGGRVISPTSGTSSTNPVQSASAQVNVPAAGTYYLWVRIAGPTATSDALYVGIDTSFDRVFPSAAGPYEWVRVETFDGSGVHGFSLAAGEHTIQVGHGEIGAKLDAVYLTADANEAPAFTAPMRLAIEAETFTLQSPMTLGSEAAALGSQFVSPTSGANSSAPAREASVTVQVPAGTYFLWARLGGPSIGADALYVGIDASFDRVFPSPTAPYQWVKVATTEGSSVFGFALAAGAHTIQVGHGEIGARLDAVYLTSDSAEVPAFAPMRRVIEAESMTLTAPMTVGVEADANGAQYISPTSGSNSTVPVREASITVNAPTAGTYFLWARLKGSSIGADALYLGFDNSWDRVFPSTSGAYQWVRVETSDGSGAHGFALSAGEHVVQVGHGEIGARLDAVYVTDDANDTPDGSTPPPSGGFPAACALPSGGYEGFGRNTLLDPNLPVRQVYRVNSLADPGVAGTPGTLRDAVSQPNRCIVFDVGGVIDMTNRSSLTVRSNVIIDGFTARDGGITLVNNKTAGANEGAESPIINISSVNNVVVRGIRIRKSPGDAIRIVNSAFNVVVDRVSISGYGDGAIDVTKFAHHVTLQWSILGSGSGFPSLIGYDASHVTVHHNLFFNGPNRNPYCGRNSKGSVDDGWAGTTLAPDVVCDVRNNLVWNYSTHGTAVRAFAKANVVKNYYYTADPSDVSKGIYITENGVAYTSGNVSRNDFNLNANGNSTTEFSAIVPTTTDAGTAANAVRAQAGARNLPNWDLDQTDKEYLAKIPNPL